MDTTTHVPLFVPDQPAHFTKKFPADLRYAATSAKAFLERSPAGVNPDELDGWVAGIDAEKSAKLRNNQARICATTGVFYSVIAEEMMAKPTRQFIGALGQTRLTLGIIGLDWESRKELLHFEQVPRARIRSALAVARLAAALNTAGARCFLPTAAEDANWKIDLIVTHGDRSACVQVKTGPNICRRVDYAEDEKEHKFLCGVAQFNAENAVRAVPLWVSMSESGAFNPKTMCSRESVHFAQYIVSILRTSPP